jgi:hypothetical protein
MLKSLEKGDLFTILMAGDFAKENGFSASEVKPYEDELEEWGLRKFL